MTSITIYNFNQNQVRTEVKNFQPWFCLNDICNILDITDKPQLRKRLNERGMCLIPTPTAGGKQKTYYINESNLYRCILKSDKPQAKNFENWICEEVLPQIRKTGAYGVPAETAPAPLDAKTLGGVVKRCAAAAVRDELETLPELVKAQVEQTVYEVLSKVFYPGITEHPSGMPFGNWAVAAVQAIGAMTSEYDNLKQKQQAVINLLQDK